MKIRDLTTEEIIAGLQRNIDALRAEGEENARHVAALEIRVRDLERIETRNQPRTTP
jgi:hypothetical protein